MSKGNRLFAFRMTAQLYALVEETIERRNVWTRNAPWTMTDFFHAAIREKIRKMRRSRKPRTRKTRPVEGSQKLTSNAGQVHNTTPA
jgi:hypothetical protein